jgi:hypothetical protein
MKAVPGDEAGPALFQRRRGLPGTGLAPLPEGIDRVLHGPARHIGISFGTALGDVEAGRDVTQSRAGVAGEV